MHLTKKVLPSLGPNNKIIGVVGSRRRNSNTDFKLCKEKILEIYKEGDYFVSGGCWDGGDKFCEQIAKSLGATMIIHHANWNLHGKGAGFIRNTYITHDCDVLIALAAHDRTGGTEDTIHKAELLNKKIILI